MESGRNHSDSINDLIDHSHAMLRHAEAGEWDTVARDEAMRRELIDAYFSNPSNIANEPEISHAIQELLRINDRLEQLTAAARDTARAEIKNIGTGRKAISAYTENTG